MPKAINSYLSHAGGLSVLLNRPVRTLSELAGSGVSEFDVRFSDNVLIDNHTSIPNAGPVAGYFLSWDLVRWRQWQSVLNGNNAARDCS